MTAGIRRGARLIVAFAIFAGIVAVILSHVPIRADMSVLLPEGEDGDLALLFTSLREGPASRTILISLAPERGAGLIENPRSLSHAFRMALENTGRFDLVADGELPQDKTAILPFFDYRYRLNPSLEIETFSEAGLRRALERLLRDLYGFKGALIQDFMAADPTLRSLEVAALWKAPPTRMRQGVWVDKDGTGVLFVAQTKGVGFELEAQAETIRRMRQAAARMESEFGPLKLTMSGPSVIAVASRDVAENESFRLILISVPLVAGLLILFLRRLSALPLLFLPLCAGFAAGTAVTAAVFGDVHITTLGFGVTLLGIAVDYPLHLMARVRSGQRPVTAARGIWGALLIAAMTTVIAFLPLTVSSFPGLAQLGVFSVVGLLAAVATTRWVLPGLMGAVGRGEADWDSAMPGAFHRRLRAGRILAFVAGMAALAVLLLRHEPLWQQDLASLSPIPESVRAQDQLLRRDLHVTDPRYVLIVEGGDEEEVLRRSEALLPSLTSLEDAGAIAGFDMVARYLPSRAAQAKRLAALPDDEILRDRLDAALKGIPFKAGTFDPFLGAIARVRQEGPIGLDDLTRSPLSGRLNSMMLDTRDGMKALVLLRGLRNPAELRKMIEMSGNEGVRYLDLKESAQRLMDGYRAETLRWVAIGAALAFGLLVATLRSVRGVAAVALPVGLSVLVTTAVMAQLAGSLSIFHLLGLLMVAGLGIDYAVFLRHGGNRGDEDAETGDAVRAVTLCAVTSFSVFALLATASVPILSQIGCTVAVGSALSYLFGLAFTAPGRSRTA